MNKNIDLSNFGNSSFIKPLNGKQIELLDDLFFHDGRFVYHHASFVKTIPQEILSAYCFYKGIYGFPTIELIKFLKKEIGNIKAIEIGAGLGILGTGLGIKQTDSKLQENNKKTVAYYQAVKQPTIKYPDHVYMFEANDAVNRFKPDVVIGSWITHKWKNGMDSGSKWGVVEERILKKVKKYIMIGHEKTHHVKPILKYLHRKIKEDWIMSRSQNIEGNVIYIWEINNNKENNE